MCVDFGRRNAGNCILDNYIYVYGGYEFDDQVDGIERLDVRKFIQEGGEISRWEMMLKSSLRCFGKPIMAQFTIKIKFSSFLAQQILIIKVTHSF